MKLIFKQEYFIKLIYKLNSTNHTKGICVDNTKKGRQIILSTFWLC